MTTQLPAAVSWQDDTLCLLDQRLLPHKVVIEPQRSVEDVFRAIRELRVRGAPAIGIAAAYGLAVALQSAKSASRDESMAVLDGAAQTLKSARPTAVNLAWAIDRVLARALLRQARTSTVWWSTKPGRYTRKIAPYAAASPIKVSS